MSSYVSRSETAHVGFTCRCSNHRNHLQATYPEDHEKVCAIPQERPAREVALFVVCQPSVVMLTARSTYSLPELNKRFISNRTRPRHGYSLPARLWWRQSVSHNLKRNKQVTHSPRSLVVLPRSGMRLLDGCVSLRQSPLS